MERVTRLKFRSPFPTKTTRHENMIKTLTSCASDTGGFSFFARASTSGSTPGTAKLGFKSGSPWFFMQTIARARSAATRAMISLADAFVNVARPSRRNLTRWRNGRLCGALFTSRLYPQRKSVVRGKLRFVSRPCGPAGRTPPRFFHRNFPKNSNFHLEKATCYRNSVRFIYSA